MGEAKRRKERGDIPESGNRRFLWQIAIFIAVAAVLVTGLYLVTRPPEPSSPDLPEPTKDGVAFSSAMDRLGIVIGNPDAPVTVREFADYQCPACARFSDEVHQLRETYIEPGDVKFVFFDLPLRQHKNSVPAAMAARCGNDQSHFWELQHRIFQTQSDWAGLDDPRSHFNDLANELNLDMPRFNRCMDTGFHREAIEKSLNLAKQIRISGTPTVYVQNVELTRPAWGQLSAVIQRELKRNEEQ